MCVCGEAKDRGGSELRKRASSRDLRGSKFEQRGEPKDLGKGAKTRAVPFKGERERARDEIVLNGSSIRVGFLVA